LDRAAHRGLAIDHQDLASRRVARRRDVVTIVEEAVGGDPAIALPVLEPALARARMRSEEHTSELQSRRELVCRLLLEKKKYTNEVRGSAINIQRYRIHDKPWI